MSRLREGLLSRKLNPRAEMPFLDHLEELRRRLLWSLAVVVLCFGVGLAAVHYLDITRYLIEPGQDALGPDLRLIYLAPADAFLMFLKISLTLGLVLASPIIIYQVWAFLAPALEKREKRVILPALFMGLALFLSGVALAYFVALPLTLRFLINFMPELMTPSWTAPGYIGFVVKLLLGFGIVFELPVVVLVLSVLGVVTPAFLRAKRRHAIVVLTIVAAMLSPGDMIQVTVLMMAPLVLLYEFSIWLSVLAWRRRERSIGGESAAGAVATAPDVPPDRGPPSGGAPSQPEGPAPRPTENQPSPYEHGDLAKPPRLEGGGKGGKADADGGSKPAEEADEEAEA